MTTSDIILVKVVNGSRQGDVYRYENASRIYIGSDAKSDICIADDPFLKPMHAQLEIDPAGCRVFVLAGRSLVRVNRRMATQATLKQGDQFTVGGTTFELSTLSTFDEKAKLKDCEKTVIVASEIEVNREGHTAISSPIVVPPGYEIIRPLGKGAMGVVYQAMHLATQSHMALKFLHSSGSGSEQSMRMFLREASVLSQLKHPRIVQFHEMGWVDGRVFLAMEYVDTIEVAKMLAALPIAKRIRLATGVICQVLDALHYAHSRNIVHRDVKPTNILVSREGKRLHSRLSDFGLAKNFENAGFSGMTKDGEVRGTVAYMAPEQFRDCLHAKPSADIFSVGVSLFHLLSNRLPFPKAKSISERLNSINEQPVSLDKCMANVPDGFSEILAKSLQLDPSSRFRTANEMRKALKPYTRTEGD